VSNLTTSHSCFQCCFFFGFAIHTA